MAIYFQKPIEHISGDAGLPYCNNQEHHLSLPTYRHTDSLPELLRKGIEQFTTENEKDLFLYSTLTVCSGLMTNVHGGYKREKIFPNLFLLVVAPPASGKSVMLYSKKLIGKIHEVVLCKSQEDKAKYDNELKAALKAKGVLPVRPPFNVVLIPANCSCSKFISHLADNQVSNTPSVVIESEIDTFNTAKSNEWGDFSDTLRKAFHGERISMSRRAQDEFVEVDTPRLAIAFSGTMNQVKKLIDNTEDGLYSRFLVQTLESTNEWQDVSPCIDCVSLSDIFEEQAGEYFKLWAYSKSKQWQVDLTKEQWAALNRYFDEKHFDAGKSADVNFQGVVRRHGVMFFKLCMVLTMFRTCQDNNESQQLLCTDQDFETAWYLVEKSLESSLKVFQRLPGAEYRALDPRKDKVFKLLPDEFTTKEALGMHEIFKVAGRTIERHLQYFVRKGLLTQPEHGKYIKVSE